jgi:hypothetical protein
MQMLVHLYAGRTSLIYVQCHMIMLLVCALVEY